MEGSHDGEERQNRQHHSHLFDTMYTTHRNFWIKSRREPCEHPGRADGRQKRTGGSAMETRWSRDREKHHSHPNGFLSFFVGPVAFVLCPDLVRDYVMFDLPPYLSGQVPGQRQSKR